MKPETISAIHDFTLQARELLEKEVSEQLEGIYGLLPDGKFEAAEKYPALKELVEAKKTRVRLEQLFEDEKAAGLTFQDARKKLVKEAAFTWLNRVVAFKMMETRSLIRQSISKGSESNGFKLWLTQPDNEDDYRRYERGDLPCNSVGEGPRDIAYWHFIIWQCEQLAREIKVLFDVNTLSSQFFPRPAILKTMIEKMNDSKIQEAWAPGNEETIGWVYQFFNEIEKKDVFDRLYKKKQKIRPEDIPAATELFTPHWIVTYLVHNSLGHYWFQMHPDSNLAEKLSYLVPLAGNIPNVPLRKAKDIRFLDPACGTMHFGLVAFDLFMDMYKEEIRKAGSPGWPEKPSVADEGKIPASIIAHNIYGLDIDLRAVQLSALTLYLRAKSLNKEASITEAHLACADVIRFDSSKLKVFLDELKLKDSVYSRVLSGIWEQLKDLGQIGSLLRFEVVVKRLIDREKREYQKTHEKPLLPGFSEKQFETEAGYIEFWEIIEQQIIQALHLFAKTQAEQGRDENLFTGETLKGFQVLNLMTKRYDVVATNPPYMARRNMNSVLADYLSEEYLNSKGDLYTAFIERCSEFLKDNGRLAMITQQSFMFISSYEKMRIKLLEHQAIETMCHVGPRAFESISGEKVNTTLFVLRREPNEKKRSESIGTYFRLVKEPDGESKRRRFEEALNRLKANQIDPIIYRYRQGDFDAIPGSPWVYWITQAIRGIFKALGKLGDIAQPIAGLRSSDNMRFLRYWWEIGHKNIGSGFLTRVDAKKSAKTWFPYMKGGSFCRWYGNQQFVVKWAYNGAEVAQAIIEAYPYLGRPWIGGGDLYFHCGVTWSDLTSGRFAARLSPGGFIFDVKGSSAFPQEENIDLILALLNSSFAQYALNLLNPTVSFQVGDLSRLPIPKASGPKLNDLVEQAIALAKSYSAEDETTYDLIAPPDWRDGIADITERHKRLMDIEREIDEEVYSLYGIEDDDRKAIEAELAEAADIESEGVESEAETEGESAGAAEEEPTSLTPEELARQWINYAVGIIMGRFEPGIENGLGKGRFSSEVAAMLRKLADADGILVIDEGHPDDFTERVLQALTIMLGDEATAEVVKAATEKDGPVEELLRQYLERTFFKLHIQQYRKRPVHWFLQSPKKKYGVWVFHEKMTKDTLFRIKTEYVEPKIKLLTNQIGDLQKRRDSAEGRERRQFETEMANLIEVLDDIREFLKRLEYIIKERGYVPHIDDGVLLNMAPLWELIPSWQTEPKKAWEELEKGEYDWAHQAMDHWPERVREKCKTNKSYAIAHGIEESSDEAPVAIKGETEKVPRKEKVKKAKGESAGNDALRKMGLI